MIYGPLNFALFCALIAPLSFDWSYEHPILLFAAAFGLSRTSYASHPRHPSRPLSVPPRFERIVRENLLQAGVLAPQRAPEAVQSSSS